MDSNGRKHSAINKVASELSVSDGKAPKMKRKR